MIIAISSTSFASHMPVSQVKHLTTYNMHCDDGQPHPRLTTQGYPNQQHQSLAYVMTLVNTGICLTISMSIPLYANNASILQIQITLNPVFHERTNRSDCQELVENETIFLPICRPTSNLPVNSPMTWKRPPPFLIC